MLGRCAFYVLALDLIAPAPRASPTVRRARLHRTAAHLRAVR
ncbi:hypothetical protein ACFHW2_27275 [Actinomadura sp. LOL_016]